MDRKTFHILVVDDEEGIREGLSLSLSLAGFHVSTACSASEALRIIGENDVPLAFIDLRLPDMSGVELVQKIDTKKTRAVVITAYATVDTAVEAMKLGAADYVQKPFEMQDILHVAENTYRNTAGTKTPVREEESDCRPLIYSGETMRKIMNVLDKIRDSSIPILLLGESGTGKEILARQIHLKSRRRDRPFVGINCAAIPRDLLESELFGYEKGAFSGADRQKPGKFEHAADGILFLDEIGDMDYRLQSKLLRAIEERQFERIGGIRPVSFRARIVASTNRDLDRLIKEGRFREDLYYRLKGVRLRLPPLRERREDILPLTEYFLSYYSGLYRRACPALASETRRDLRERMWRGNVRELKNAVETVILLYPEKTVLLPEDFPAEELNEEDEEIGEKKRPLHTDMQEKKKIVDTLARHRFNRSMTAAALNISRKTLYNKMKKYRIG